MDANQGMSNNRRHIPPEIVEEILVRLPIKSVFRFTRVSKSWRSLILEPNFTKKRAAVREISRLAMSPKWGHPWFDTHLVDSSSSSLCSVFSDNAVEDATPIICPIKGIPILHAFSGELWCVEEYESLHLWNPSINTYKKVRNPSTSSDWQWRHGNYIYGLGYDSVNDDHKLLKLSIGRSLRHRSELYSLRSDSWRTINVLPPFCTEHPVHQQCVFVKGSLHWVINSGPSIASFELATEKYGRVVPPPEEPAFVTMTVAALRGKLGVVGRREKGCVLWVMEEYGVEKSWTKKFDIKYGDVIRGYTHYTLIPLHIFDNGEILLRVSTFHEKYSALFIYKGEETGPGTTSMVWREICEGFVYNERKMTMVCRGISDSFIYDEGLFSPAARGPSERGKNNFIFR